MHKIRCSLATLALIVTLSGLSLQGLGGAVANATVVHHASSALMIAKLARSDNARPNWPCPGGTTTDC